MHTKKNSRVFRLGAMLLLIAVLLGAMLPTFVLAESTIPEWPPMKLRTVQPGDTYIKIAAEEGLKGWHVLQKVNGWKPTEIPVWATINVPQDWYLVTSATGNEKSGEISGVAQLLKNRVDTKIYGRYAGFGYLPVGNKDVPVLAVALGVGPENVQQMIDLLYSMFPTQPVLQLHGGINGGKYEVGSSVVPKTVCTVADYYNYPVLGPSPIFPNEGESLSALAKRLGWSEAEIATVIERNPGKIPADRNMPIRKGLELVGPRDDNYDDNRIPRGYTMYFADSTSWAPPNGCLSTPDSLFQIGVAAAKSMEMPMVPISITKWIELNGRDPKGASKVYADDGQCLCGGGDFYASTVNAWWLGEVRGCDGLDMETPTVARATASATNSKEPRVVFFRTSSDPPWFNPGQPTVTATDYLKDPAGTYTKARTSVTEIFKLPVGAHQARAYASFVKTFIGLHYGSGK